jgi:DNA-binding NtrC family response regulator
LLAILPAAHERSTIRSTFSQLDWHVGFATTFPQARAALREQSVGIVLTESQFSDGHSWKDFLDEFQGMQCPPRLIVTAASADSRLWAEVLNLGGYDLLLKPLDPAEVFRVVTLAWLSRKHKPVIEDLLREGVSQQHDLAVMAGALEDAGELVSQVARQIT